jgi:hypothetical protein
MTREKRIKNCKYCHGRGFVYVNGRACDCLCKTDPLPFDKEDDREKPR